MQQLPGLLIEIGAGRASYLKSAWSAPSTCRSGALAAIIHKSSTANAITSSEPSTMACLSVPVPRSTRDA